MAAKRRAAYQALGYRMSAAAELDLRPPMPMFESLRTESR
jgi:hypothetical protein